VAVTAPSAPPAPPARTRERILEAAMELFAQDGFAGTTIAEIERRAGLAPGSGSLYRHFPSKEALLKAAVDYEVTRCRTDMANARASIPRLADPDADRTLTYHVLLHELRRFDRLFRLMLHEGDRVPELREAIWNAARRPTDAHPAQGIDALAMAALGGYHLFSLMQGRAFNEIPEDDFIRLLVDVTARVDEPQDAR
jgi:AcrR family transcriptional regulator